MAVRLSRAAWNNVIIFSVMGFILLINLTQGNKESNEGTSTSAVQHVIGENKVILTMNVDQQVTIERAGQSWRMMPERITPQLLDQMMRTWHQATGQIADLEIDRNVHNGLFISMVLADQQNIQMLTLYLLEQQVVIHNHQTNQYLLLPAPMFNQLIPTGLLTQ